jgi:hypothetical protein
MLIKKFSAFMVPVILLILSSYLHHTPNWSQLQDFFKQKLCGEFMGPRAAMVAMKALQKPRKDDRIGSGEPKVG